MNRAIPQADYRLILRSELEARSAKNSAYSLRSFARDLGISPARLSDVLRGRYGLSRKAAEVLGAKLGWTKAEILRFADLVESAHARDKRKKEAARVRVSAASASYQQLTLDGFQVVSDWYHYAILELSTIAGFQGDPTWIAKRLGISVHAASAAMERLLRLELLEQDEAGNFRPSSDFTASPDGIPSEAIKKFHRQILEKALLAVDFQNVEERDFSSMVMAIDEQDLPAAKEEIRNFRRSFDARFGQKPHKNKVYCLSTQLFRLQENTKEKK